VSLSSELSPESPFASLILDHLSGAVVLLDRDLIVLHCNQAAEGLLAVSRQHAVGQRFSDLTRDADDLVTAFQQALDTATPFTQRQTHLTLHATHQNVSVDITATPLPDRCLLLEIQTVDRLLRISREEAVVSSQQTSRHLARGLAHEIKNPLGGIRGAAQLLARTLPDTEKEYTRIIIEEADRLRDLVDRMLGSQEPPVLSPINVHEVLERALSLLRVECGEVVRFERDYDPSCAGCIGRSRSAVTSGVECVAQCCASIARKWYGFCSGYFAHPSAKAIHYRQTSAQTGVSCGCDRQRPWYPRGYSGHDFLSDDFRARRGDGFGFGDCTIHHGATPRHDRM
jgi:signal transduction histidine kinase